MFRKILLVLFIVLFSNIVAADAVKNELVQNVWKLERNTSLGKVNTVWMFFEDGSGRAYQKIDDYGRIKTKNHKFTYSINDGHIIVQEEIAKEWEGHFGVTRWRLIDHKLICDVQFREEVIIFTPINLSQNDDS